MTDARIIRIDAGQKAARTLEKPQFFVTVFGDPEAHGDTVDSGIYTSGAGYGRFPVKPGDVMLLYCTEGYAAYSRQVPGFGVVLRVDPESTASTETIKYRWIPFDRPIPKTVIDKAFEIGDRKKMQELRFNTRRVFAVSKQSFLKAAADRVPAWGKL